MRNMERIPVIFITVLVLAGCSSEQHPARTNKGIAKGCEASSVTLTASVTDYGAVGDGDGSKAVANAIAFNNAIANLSVKGGGELFIPDGTYMLAPDTRNSVIVRLKSHIHVRCESHSAILKSNGQLPMSVRMMGLADLNGSSITDVVIDGCSFDGSDPAPDGTSEQSHAIMLWTADPGSITNVIITNNFIKDFPGDGVQMSNNSSDICVVGNHIQNVGRAGIGAGTGGRSKRGDYYIANNQFEPAPTVASSRGIDLEVAVDMNDVLIEENILNKIEVSSRVSSTTERWTIRNNQTYAGGIFVGGSNDVLIENNTINQTPTDMAGISVIQRAYRFTVINNNITVITDQARIRFDLGMQGGSDITVTNNVVQGKTTSATKDGLDVLYSQGVSISGNTISGFYSGISVGGSSTFLAGDILVDKNSAYGAVYGININDYITGATIQYNTFSGRTDDVRLAGTDAHSSGIVLRYNTLVHKTLLNVYGQTFSS